MKKTSFRTSEYSVFQFNHTTFNISEEKTKGTTEVSFETHVFENMEEFIDKVKYIDMVVTYPHLRSLEYLEDGRLKFYGAFLIKEARRVPAVY
jgi:hypothetical protein